MAPVVTVVVETTTLLEHGEPPAEAAARLLDLLRALERQPVDEVLVSVGTDATGRTFADAVATEHPAVRVLVVDDATYYSMKNAGAAAASGEVVAFIDADCIPEPGWLAAGLDSLARGADASVGCTRYRSRSLRARTWDLFDFGFVRARRDGTASGLVENNLVMRRTVAAANPMDERFTRTGASVVQLDRLRRNGALVVYAPRQRVGHADDWADGGWLQKRLRNGYDAVNVARVDADVHRGWRARPVVLAAARLADDAVRVARHRDRAAGDLPWPAVPWLWGAALVARSAEAAAGVAVRLGRDDALARRFG